MSRPTVTLRQGTFVGTELKRDFPQTLDQFLGIPYGLSTAGERRFKPPVRVASSTATFDASRFGQRCPSGIPDGVPMGEDCLNANIYRPKQQDKKQKAPVVVHFHGGAFNFGSGHGRDIASLVAWSSEPILGITFNYRLGAFGFLPIEGSLNLGLKDQVLLLEWVQENVAAFGGDPDNVTLMGVSAGAHSVSISSTALSVHNATIVTYLLMFTNGGVDANIVRLAITLCIPNQIHCFTKPFLNLAPLPPELYTHTPASFTKHNYRYF